MNPALQTWVKLTKQNWQQSRRDRREHRHHTTSPHRTVTAASITVSGFEFHHELCGSQNKILWEECYKFLELE